MLVHRKASLAAALALSASAAFAQEQTFNVYGFADAGFDKSDIASNNFLNFYVPSDFVYQVRHFNIYFDWKPNANTRALLEMAFINNQDITMGTSFPNRRIINYIAGWNAYMAQMDPFLTPAQKAALSALKERSDTTIVMGQKLAEFNLPMIERAYFEILANPYANLRLGRFITPAGIWNVDHGSPVILTIKQPYQTAVIPIFPKSQDGAMLFGGGYFGDHDYEYQAYVSTGSGLTDNDLPDLTYLSGGAKASVKLDLPVKTKVGASAYSGLARRTDRYNLAQRNFTVNDFTTVDPTLQVPLPDPAKFAQLGQIGDDEYEIQTTVNVQDRQLAFGIDLRLDFKGAFIQSEYNTRTNKNELKNDAESKFFGYYVILGYKQPFAQTASITPYFMYEALGWEDVINSGGEGTFGYLPMEGFDSFLGGVNVGLFGNVYLKLEYSLAKMRKLEAPPAFPTFKNNYSDSDLDITTFSGQFAIAF